MRLLGAWSPSSSNNIALYLYLLIKAIKTSQFPCALYMFLLGDFLGERATIINVPMGLGKWCLNPTDILYLVHRGLENKDPSLNLASHTPDILSAGSVTRNVGHCNFVVLTTVTQQLWTKDSGPQSALHNELYRAGDCHIIIGKGI